MCLSEQSNVCGSLGSLCTVPLGFTVTLQPHSAPGCPPARLLLAGLPACGHLFTSSSTMNATPSHTHPHPRCGLAAPLLPGRPSLVCPPPDTSWEPLMPTLRSSSCSPVISPSSKKRRLILSLLLFAGLQMPHFNVMKQDEEKRENHFARGCLRDRSEQMDSETRPLVVYSCRTCDPDRFISSLDH